MRRTLFIAARREFSRTYRVSEAQVDYSRISELIKSKAPKQKLIDVREPNEYTAGNIPTSVNIPLSTIKDTFSLEPTEFESTTGMKKPDVAEEVIFYCRAGVRSTAASKIAEELGYRNVGNYKGSWNDFAAKSPSSQRAYSTSAKNPNQQDGAGQGAAGGIDLKKMNQQEEARAEGDKKQEGGQKLEGAGQEESESVTSGAEMAKGKKFE